jgi:hypothetical protein
MNTGNFLAELKRGNVYKVAVAYPIVSWLLFQIVILTSGRGPSVAGERAYSFGGARDFPAALKVWEATANPAPISIASCRPEPPSAFWPARS